MPGNLGNLYFIFEIFAAEMIFMYSYPKRSRFVLRYAIVVLAVFIVGYFVPRFSGTVLGGWGAIFRFLILWGLTTAGMCCCFSVPVPAVISACAAAYALQHFSYKLLDIIKLTGIFDFVHTQFISANFIKELMLFPFTYVAAFFVFGRLSAKNRYYNTDMRFNVISILTVLTCIVLNRFISFDRTPPAVICVSLYSMMCTLFALVVQYNLRQSCAVQEEARIMRKVLQEKEIQYETNKRNIDLINIKCHDLKYSLTALHGRLPQEEIDRITSAIDAYDESIKTGNDVLDVLLIEKNMQCRSLGIGFTCMGDGECLSFLAPVDLYSLFGNALDNAVEAVLPLGEPGMKQIGMTIEERNDLIVLTVFNYFSGSLELRDGLPVSTKQSDPGYHGYGLKSIRMIAEKYSGELHISTADDIFTLTVYIKKPL